MLNPNKRKLLVLSVALIFSIITSGQTKKTSPVIQTKEVKIEYSNGIKIFNICVENCKTEFLENVNYTWYNEYSKIKSTKGGAGGNLLHGNYKMYVEGNLFSENNYYLGVLNGTQKDWDSIGNLIQISKYIKGKMTYWKFKNDENLWIEYIGAPFESGTIKNVFTNYGNILSNEITLPNTNKLIKTYYEFSGKLKSEFSSYSLGWEARTGTYKSYFENGKIEIEGQFLDDKKDYINSTKSTNLKDGIWTYYNSDGTIDFKLQFKADIAFWANGNKKHNGVYVFSEKTNKWLMHGLWIWFKEDGSFQYRKNFEWGEEVSSE